MDRPLNPPARSENTTASIADPIQRMRPETDPRGPLPDATGHTCEVCGNKYDKSFQVILAGETHTFDSFECAVHRLAPTCAHCRCRILGHGIEAAGIYYCCSNCARQSGVDGTQDRARE